LPKEPNTVILVAIASGEVMKSILFVLLAVIVALGECGSALAAKKKSAPQSPPKLIYEAPMIVVIVRNNVSACEPNCPEWIAAEGEITDGTPAKFRDVFKRMGKKQLPIIIRSPGGSINAALEIGKMIRKRKLDVAVGSTQFDGCGPNRKDCKLPKENKGIYRGTASSFYGFCNSACPLILAAGTTRLASFDTLVGVHKPKIVWNQERVYYRETYRMVNGKKKVLKRTVTGRKRGKDNVTFEFGKQLRKKLANYYASMGVDPAIMVDSEKAAYKEMEILRGARLDALKLRTSSRNAGTLTDWIICRREPMVQNCIKGDAPSQKSKQLAALRASMEAQEIKLDDPDMTFTLVRYFGRSCEPSCPEWIAAKGVIRPETPKVFAVFLKQFGSQQRNLVIESPGGDLDATLAFGKLIREHGLSVAAAVTRYFGCQPADKKCKRKDAKRVYKGMLLSDYRACSGACVLALAAGKQRLAWSLRAPTPAVFASATSSQPAEVIIHSYLGELGFNPKFIQMLLEVPTQSQRLFAEHELISSGLVTLQESTETFSEKEKCGTADGSANCVRR
jgi:hypothetical protein